MPVYIERVILPIVVAVVMGICVLNPWKWDWQQKVSLGLGTLLIGYFFAYTSYKMRAETTKAPARVRISGDAATSGDNSPADTGDGNSFQSDQKPKPPAKE